MYERILVPTDGSDGAAKSMTEAFDLAEEMGGMIHALYVIDTRNYNTLSDTKWLTLEDELSEIGEQALEDVEAQATARGIPVKTSIERGIPHEEILSYATDIDADVIVMGTHGRSGLQHFLMGSVTEKVIRSTGRPVLVIRGMDDERSKE
ncbi:universal stress protein [Haladaptatus sp. AB618]|uniref:universal stress protein n=1 Tax=Haladaptatus sp. AB618 TaxID=2934173 RepID=UPI00209BBB9A|nr:universal stress protein [Haladaptatus sp. AB618]MCO8256005.1 universal stress protein [Haladaptatus sp. AB618]